METPICYHVTVLARKRYEQRHRWDSFPDRQALMFEIRAKNTLSVVLIGRSQSRDHFGAYTHIHTHTHTHTHSHSHTHTHTHTYIHTYTLRETVYVGVFGRVGLGGACACKCVCMCLCVCVCGVCGVCVCGVCVCVCLCVCASALNHFRTLMTSSGPKIRHNSCKNGALELKFSQKLRFDL